MKWVMSRKYASVSLIEYCDVIDWWEAERLTAIQACNKLQDELFERVEREIDGISYQHLLAENSNERESFEASISKAIQKLDARLLMTTVKDPGLEIGAHVGGKNLSGYEGWSLWDIGKIFAGGGSAGGVLLAGSRAVPLALPAAGLATLAAPVTIVAGLAGLAWSAYSVSGQKRSQYLQVLKEGITGTLTATDQPDRSVLSRQLARLELLRDFRLGQLK